MVVTTQNSSLHVLDKSALYGSSQEVFVLRAVPPAAAQPAAQKDASRRSRVPIYPARHVRRGIRHLSSYQMSPFSRIEANPQGGGSRVPIYPARHVPAPTIPSE